MDRTELLQNADFLEIAMEQMDDDSVEYEFVEDVYSNLVQSAQQ
jgi:hypothetical protein